jgi:hypothetical protein
LGSRFFCEAELTLFASFSGKRRLLIDYLNRSGVLFVGGFGPLDILRSRTNAFCFFFWKKKTSTRLFEPSMVSLDGTFMAQVFCEAELRFLLLFLEKEEGGLICRVVKFWEEMGGFGLVVVGRFAGYGSMLEPLCCFSFPNLFGRITVINMKHGLTHIWGFRYVASI